MLERVLRPRAELAYAVLRFLSGLAFSQHGVQKLFGLLGGHKTEMFTLAWLAGVIELVTGVAMAVGFRTTWAAFLASGTMAYAYLVVHWHGQMDEGFFPVVNKGELAFIYCFLFLFIACKGTGSYGVDKRGK